MSEYNVKLRSNYLNGTIDINIIMPNPFLAFNPQKFYESGEKFPVVWLLHGGKDTYADWITFTSVARQAIYRNVIIVAPQIPNSDFINQPLVGEGFPIQDFFFHELMPFIHNWFPASCASEKNFLIGEDMGAEAAWRYGLIQPDVFGYIVPISKVPCDYNYLEPYRMMTAAEFFDVAKEGKIPAAYGKDGDILHIREINNICKYPIVGNFIDSYENTMRCFDEAAKQRKLPKIFLPGREADYRLAKFKNHAEQLGAKIVFDLFDIPADPTEFIEEAVERFLDFAGIENVEVNDGKAPHMPGVHDFLDESYHRTVY